MEGGMGWGEGEEVLALEVADESSSTQGVQLPLLP